MKQNHIMDSSCRFKRALPQKQSNEPAKYCSVLKSFALTSLLLIGLLITTGAPASAAATTYDFNDLGGSSYNLILGSTPWNYGDFSFRTNGDADDGLDYWVNFGQGSSGGIGVVASDIGHITQLSIKRTDNQPFLFKGIWLANDIGAPAIVIKGYVANTATGDQEAIDISSAVTKSYDWTVDEVRIEGADLTLFFDNFAFETVASNSAPTAASFTASPIYQNTPYAFATANFGYSDHDGDPLDHVRITSAPAVGSLWVDSDNSGTINGAESALTNNGTVSKANLDAGYLKYLNTTGTSSSFAFDVNDGTDFSASTYTTTLTVTPEPTVTLSLDPSSTIAENGGTTNVKATLSHSFDKSVTVNLVTSGTATGSGTDYNLSATAIVINAGSTSNTVTIAGVDDLLDEDNETTIVDITSVSNGTESGTQQVTCTITDDDTSPTVSFTAASQSSIDETGNLTVTAQLSAASGRDVTVPFSINGAGTATGGGTDYTISASPLTIAAGATTADITLTITADSLDEDNETVIIDMEVPTNATQGVTSSHTATISDDDAAPTVSFTAASQSSVNESGSLTLTAQLSAVSSKDVSVPFSVNGASSATGGGTDYAISASPLTIAAGATTADITITIIADSLDEADETVIIDMGVPTNATQGVTSNHTATISDDDAAPTVSFTAASQSSVNESGSLTLTAQLSAVSGQEVTVPFSVNGASSATGGGTDYAISASPLTIAAGATTADITITIASDSLDEADETVIIDMGVPTNATQGVTSSHAATISDDDAPPTVSFTAASQSSGGESGTLTLTAQLSAASGRDVTVPFSVNGAGTATGGGTDYTISASPLTIAAGATTADITITIASDSLDEADETVIIDMGVPTNATQGATTSHAATITDDDAAPTVSFTAASQTSIDESGTLIITAQLSAASSKEVSVPFSVNAGSSATGGGTDYVLNASPLTIAAGATAADITVTIIADSLDETDETVIIDMGAPTNANLGTTTSHTASITDDDTAPTVSFTAASQVSVGESGSLTLTAQLSTTSSKQISVPFTINAASSATGGGTDYTISASPITFAAGATTADITITITTDSLDETNETVIIDMGTPVNAIKGATTSHTATITDDDGAPTVRFTTANQTSADESGSLTITAQLSAVSGQEVTVPFTINAASSATGSGTDYAVSASPLTIAAGATTADITLTITTDSLDEADETIIIDMGAPTNASQGATTSHTATITDDDGAPTVSFTAASQSSAGESGSLTLTVQLSTVSGKEVSVPFSVNGSSSATGGGTDYAISASPLTIAAGDTTADLTITIAADSLDEKNETVIIDLGTPTNATQGATTSHTATITDDDGAPTVSFTAASQSSAGESGSLTLTVQLSAASGKEISVPFTVNAGSSATGGGVDYVLSPGPITIAAGATSANITITIAADSLDEAAESVIIDMGTPTNATLGTTTSHTATITDDDAAPTVSFTAPTQTSSDESGSLTLTARLSVVSGLDVVIPFAINTGSSATGGGTDYTLSANPLTIAAGATTATLTVTIVDDPFVEGNESLIIDMGAAINASLGATTQHTVTITDNDSAGFRLSQSSGTTEVAESATSDSFTLVLSAMPTSNVVLDISCQDPGEVSVSPTLVTFTPANWNSAQTVTVTGVDDEQIDGIQITTITVAVQDAASADAFDPLAAQTISVLTRDDDAPLQVANAISDVAVVEGSANTVIDLSTTFENPNDSSAEIVKSVADNSNAALVVATISGNTLTLAYQADQRGAATITVRATSNGKTVDDSFSVSVQPLQEATFERIQQYAATSDASALTIAELVAAGVVGAKSTNLTAYKETISAQSEIADLATLQTLIYQVNALERIKQYALNSDASPLTMEELDDAGVEGALAEHLALYQQEIEALESLADLAALQALIERVHALVTIQHYADQGDAADMKLAELQLTGSQDLYYYNLPAYRLAVEDAETIDSLLVLQELIAAANLASALDQGAAAITLPDVEDEAALLDQLKEDSGCSLPVTDDEGEVQQVELQSQLPTPETMDQDGEEGRITFVNSFAGAQLSTVIDEQGFVEQQVRTADGNEGGVACMWLDLLAQTTAEGVMTLQTTIPYTDSEGVTTPLQVTSTLQPNGQLQANVERAPAGGEATTSTLDCEGANGAAVIQADGSLLLMLNTALSGNPVSATGHVDSAGRVDGVVVQGGVETRVNSLLPGSDVTVLDDGRLQLRSVQVIDFAAADIHGDQYDDLFYVDDTDHKVLYSNADITPLGQLWTGYTIVRNGVLEQQYDTLATTPDDGYSNRFPAQASASITTDDNGDPRLIITTTLELPLQF